MKKQINKLSEKENAIRNFFISNPNILKEKRIRDIMKEFHVGLPTITKSSWDIIAKNLYKKQIIRKNGKIILVTLKKLPDLLGYSEAWIEHLIYRKKIQYKILPRLNPNGYPKIIYTKYYDFQQIISCFPKFKEGYLIECKPAENVLRKRPKGMFIAYYYIFCVMLAFKIDTDNWPTIKDIHSVIKGKYTIDNIQHAIEYFLEKGFIAHKNCLFKNLLRRQGRYSFIVYKGPEELLKQNGKFRDFCSKNCKLF